MSHTFNPLKEDNLARFGRCQTQSGTFSTPAFMPVGTKASVKGVDVERLKEAGAQITLVNTYHLWLRPGPERIHSLGGIQKFCAFNGPILSDSGGFQVFSLKGIRKVTDEGVEFQSHLDGAKMFLSPEKSLQIQETLGVDIAMVLDECPESTLSESELERSLHRTIEWAKRSVISRNRSETAVFAITQGGMNKRLRTFAAEELTKLPFDGFAIGGLSVGEPKEQMYEVLSYHPHQLPKEKIRYLMGVGTPEDIIYAVSQGVDLFDCVMPTRSGRFGRAFISGDEPFINIRNTRFALDTSPLDIDCNCVCCRNYSRAYIHHLFKVDEMLGPQMLSVHNVTFYLRFMERIRKAIQEGRFSALLEGERARWKDFQMGNLGEL